MRIAAVDLGGTRCKAALIETASDLGPAVVKRVEPVEVIGLGGDEALAVVSALVRDLGSVEGVGLSLPGLHEDGTVIALPGKFPGLEGTSVRDRLHSMLDVPVHLCNDAIAAAVGEAVAGAAADARTALVVTIGTGVGTAVVVDGQPVGAGHLAGGILGGQIPISEPDGPLDTSGRAGTIEARCRAERIVAEARAVGFEGTTVPAVLAAAGEGDPSALEGIRAWQGWFLRALVALAHAHAPEVIVVGGGPVQPASPLLEGIEEGLGALTWPGYRPRVTHALLGDDAGTIGAAHLADRALT